MVNPFARLRRWLGGDSARVSKAAPAPLHALPREQLRAAFSLALGPGVSRRLAALGQRSGPAVERLEQLFTSPSETGQPFAGLVRQLSSPDLLVLALLLREMQAGLSADERRSATRIVCDHLELTGDVRGLVEFLVNDDLRMWAGDVDALAGYVSSASLLSAFATEEYLKMLAVMTLVTGEGGAPATPEQAARLWKLYLDTYNHLTKAYGDELIDVATIRRTPIGVHRPSSISEAQLAAFLGGLPKRYLTLFDAASIYEHVRACEKIGKDDVRCFLKKSGGGLWELTVATLDKPFLFSNTCGLLSYLGMDILSGQAMTSAGGLVLDVFRFHDHHGVLERDDPKPLLIDVIAGRVDIDALIRGRHRPAPSGQPAPPPAVAFDNASSARCTVIEVVAQDGPGLLYRISRALSLSDCEIEMVVIATEQDKAHDVFHVTKRGAKVPDGEQRELTDAIHRACFQ